MTSSRPNGLKYSYSPTSCRHARFDRFKFEVGVPASFATDVLLSITTVVCFLMQRKHYRTESGFQNQSATNTLVSIETKGDTIVKVV